MFGFINISKDDVSAAEQERWISAYCGLCHVTGEEEGQLARLAQSNDLTFLTLLLNSLYEPDEEARELTCAVHPLAPRLCVSSRFTRYAADMTVALAYHKALDDWNDEGKRVAKMYSGMLEKRYGEVAARWPRQCRALEEGLAAIGAIEQRVADAHAAAPASEPASVPANAPSNGPASVPLTSADDGVNLFGRVLGELYVVDESDFWADTLRALGVAMGRFVYLMDAAVDLPDDEQSGAYNPFAGRGFTPDDLRAILTDALSRAAEIFERLPLERDLHLMRSVLYSGVWVQFNKKYNTEANEEAAPNSATAVTAATAETDK